VKNLLKDWITICSVLVILIVLAWSFYVPRTVSDEAADREGAANARHSAAGATSSQLSSSTPDRLAPYFEQFSASISAIGNARGELLRRAAQDPYDDGGLESAALAYRNGILQLRHTLSNLRMELGPTDAEAIVRMMMSQNAMVSQRMLTAEVFGEL
jgi:hypothetical protein